LFTACDLAGRILAHNLAATPWKLSPRGRNILQFALESVVGAAEPWRQASQDRGTARTASATTSARSRRVRLSASGSALVIA